MSKAANSNKRNTIVIDGTMAGEGIKKPLRLFSIISKNGCKNPLQLKSLGNDDKSAPDQLKARLQPLV